MWEHSSESRAAVIDVGRAAAPGLSLWRRLSKVGVHSAVHNTDLLALHALKPCSVQWTWLAGFSA